ncbi:hypothetical protein LBMAG42_35620 [Deltaproteobacteria bacterium]|nr:hypothetical protein LBMAG42_35620 [Deltaproteobacteria bacterium]
MRVAIIWDPAKNDANVRKHGVSFEEAQALFASGEDYLELFDDAHSDTEDRFIAIGPIARGLVLVVWTEWEDEVVRIISARWATPFERTLYINHPEGKP